MGRFEQRYVAIDRFQQRHAWLGLPLAVLQKYSDDQGAYLAATITYYGFFAIFPLMLVLTTALGFLLPGHHDLERSVVDSALSRAVSSRSALALSWPCGRGWASSSPHRTP
jgi:uncharacterized BrkB/YihY/UPF0761 family membrane protein